MSNQPEYCSKCGELTYCILFKGKWYCGNCLKMVLIENGTFRTDY